MKLFGNTKRSRPTQRRNPPQQEARPEEPQVFAQRSTHVPPRQEIHIPKYEESEPLFPNSRQQEQRRTYQQPRQEQIRPQMPQRPAPRPEPERSQAPQKVEVEDENSQRKALLLLIASACVFICALIMCLVLINQSAAQTDLPTMPSSPVKDIKYVVNVAPPETVEMPVELVEPVSKYDSERLNILILGLQEDKNDVVMLASINLVTRELSLLSVQRETYISGNYEDARLGSVYPSASKGDMLRGIRAVSEQVAGMVGFRPDYYFVLDEAAMTAILQCTGAMTFELPEKTTYSELSGGEYELDAETAMAILSYREGYDDVRSAPTVTQRQLVLSLLEALLTDESSILGNAEAIAQAATTDLSAQDLAYLGYLLYGMDFKTMVSEVLPGESIEVDGREYLEVNSQNAVELLNACFNPLPDDLTVFTVNFRQKTGSSTDGTFDSYGFSSSSEDETDETEEEDNSDHEDNSDETEDEEDTSSSSEEEASSEETQPSETNAPPDNSDAE